MECSKTQKIKLLKSKNMKTATGGLEDEDEEIRNIRQ